MKTIKWVVIVSMLTAAILIMAAQMVPQRYINAALLECAKVRYSILLGGLDV